MVATYTVTVYRKNLAKEFQVGGQGYRWLDRVKLAMHTACVKNAPARTGGLAGAHRSYIRGINQYACQATIVNTAEHAEWVHEGTDGAEAPSDWLYLPAGGPGRNTVSPYAGSTFRKKRLRFVRGQNANPWMDESCTRIAMTRGAIRYS